MLAKVLLIKMKLQQLKELFKVYEFAKNAHESINQKRKSGEDYITHPLRVANIAKFYGADQETLYACLLHDVIEDTLKTLEQIANEFGEEVAFLVDGVTKIDNDAEKTFEKIKQYSEKDPRIILIKLCDRIHNSQNLEGLEKIKKKYKKSNPNYIKLGLKYGYQEPSKELNHITLDLIN